MSEHQGHTGRLTSPCAGKGDGGQLGRDVYRTLTSGWLLAPKFPRTKHTHGHSEGASLASKTGRLVGEVAGSRRLPPALAGAPAAVRSLGRGVWGQKRMQQPGRQRPWQGPRQAWDHSRRSQRRHENSTLRTVANYFPNSRALNIRTDNIQKTGGLISECRERQAPSRNGTQCACVDGLCRGGSGLRRARWSAWL